MKSNFIFTIAVILLNVYGMKAQGVLFDKQYLEAVQSDDYTVQDAGYVFDGIYNNSVQNTEFDFDEIYNNSIHNGANNSGALWIQINTKCIRRIQSIKLYTSSVNYYVFLSKSPFYHRNIEALIRDPWVTYFNITSGEGGSTGSSRTIPVGNLNVQYILILSNNLVNGSIQQLHINEIDIYGDHADCGPHLPPNTPPIIGHPLNPPYGTCGPWFWPPNNPPVLPPYIIGPPFVWVGQPGVWPWWSSPEICGDGIDNDNNGLTDCEDYPCGVGTFNVVLTSPTCPICQNGRICIYANSHVKQVSIDNGATWTGFPNSGIFCFENLNAGSYQVKLRTYYGCEDGKDVILSAPLVEDELCENGGFEEGTFNHWVGGIAFGYSTNFDNTTLDINNRHTIQMNNFVDPYVPFISGMQGTYCAKLGNNIAGFQSERLTYCFIVDNNNKNLSFNYAAVLEIPANHQNDDLPFFEYKNL